MGFFSLGASQYASISVVKRRQLRFLDKHDCTISALGDVNDF